MRKRAIFLLAFAACALFLAFGLSACEHVHSYGKWEVVKEANCTENGLRISSCSCGKVLNGVIYAGHIEVVDPAVEGSCTVEGLTEGKHCSRCGEVLIEQQNLGVRHTADVRDGTSPSCTQLGLTDEEYCLTCGEVLKPHERIRMLPHMFEDGSCIECGVPEPSEGITYRPVYENDTVTSYYVFDGSDCVSEDVVIADQYEGLPVTAVGTSAFSGNKSVKTVYFPRSIETVGSSAFFACPNLNEMLFFDSLTEIGDNAFAKCSGITEVDLPASVQSLGTGVFWDCTALTQMSIPNGVKEIRADAFFGCLSLKSVSFGNGLESIGERAFAWCTALYELSLPDGFVRIGDRAFGACKTLRRVSLPSTVETIGNLAFSECYSLVEICNGSSLELEAGSDAFGGIAAGAVNLYKPDEGASKFTVTDDGFLFYDSGEAIELVGYVGGQSKIVLPDDFQGEKYTIVSNAFFGTSPQLTSVTLTLGVGKIEIGAFVTNSQITEFKFLGTVQAWLDLPKEDFWRFPMGFDEVICSDGIVTKDGNIIIFE
ncbi:MAG: leucine-rich repeat domain-containing protein [Clostridiales bacterium]|nr:leucine-rich repeat domain-containing protein [Clostridiales bacterium]